MSQNHPADRIQPRNGPDLARGRYVWQPWCNSRRKTYFAEYSQQSHSFNYSHWIFLWLILKSWLFDPALINDCLVIIETHTTSKPKKIQRNRQWAIQFSHRSLLIPRFNFMSCNLILRLSCRLSNSPTKSSRSVSQLVLLFYVDQCYPIFHWQGRTQGGGLGLTPPLNLMFYKSLLPAQRRLTVFA